MKLLATITDEQEISLFYDADIQGIVAKTSDESWTIETGALTEALAIEFIMDSYSYGWNLTWVEGN